MTAATSAFDVEALSASLRGTAFRIHFFDEIGSTNTHAMQAGADGAPHGSVYVAGAQTAGRGRGAHIWASPPGSGLYVSILLRPGVGPGDALLFSLAAGLAAQAAVRETAGVAADIRWPNDLLVGRRKLGGILSEMHAEVTRVRFLVIGVGINVHQQEFPPELAATSLAIENPRHQCSRERLLASLLLHLQQETAQMDRLPQRLEAASSWVRGKRVTVGEDMPFSGVTEGLDARGFLLVRTDGGELRTVLSGAVRERE